MFTNKYIIDGRSQISAINEMVKKTLLISRDEFDLFNLYNSFNNNDNYYNYDDFIEKMEILKTNLNLIINDYFDVEFGYISLKQIMIKNPTIKSKKGRLITLIENKDMSECND